MDISIDLEKVICGLQPRMFPGKYEIWRDENHTISRGRSWPVRNDNKREI
jgi:hypothetical protein